MEGKTNFPRRLQAVRNRNCWVFEEIIDVGCNLKQFDDFTWLTLTAHILRLIYATVCKVRVCVCTCERVWLADEAQRSPLGHDKSVLLGGPISDVHILSFWRFADWRRCPAGTRWRRWWRQCEFSSSAAATTAASVSERHASPVRIRRHVLTHYLVSPFLRPRP